MALTLPEGHRFAFTILDDTDDATLENVRPVYDRLAALGFRTTKTAWPLDCPEGSRLFFAADTLARSDYLDFVRELGEKGFEIAMHGATMESSLRERTERALAFLERELGAVPRLYANHGLNRENLYWGPNRFRALPMRVVERLLGRGPADYFCGDEPASPYFWGDRCREHVEYVRNFTFHQLDVLGCDPHMPYALASTPYVRAWFSTSDAPDARSFKHLVTPSAIDALVASGGVCIVSTHLGKGFVRDGALDPDVDAALVHLARQDGWFVPVSQLLDFLRERAGRTDPGALALARLELRYLRDQLRSRWRGDAGSQG